MRGGVAGCHATELLPLVLTQRSVLLFNDNSHRVAASRKSLGVHVVRRCETLAATATATATATAMLTEAASSNIKITNKSSAQRGKTKASFVRREKLVK